MSGTTQGAPSGSMLVSGRSASVGPVSLGYYPREGSMGATAVYNWSVNAAYADDLSQLQALGIETTIQGAFVDNSQNSAAVTIYVPATNQQVVVPAYAQGMFPLILSGMASVQISSTVAAGSLTRVTYLNVPVQASLWSTQGPAAPGSSVSAGLLSMGTVLTVNPFYTAGQSYPLSLDTQGSLKVNLSLGAGGTAMAGTANGSGTAVMAGAQYRSSPSALGNTNNVCMLVDAYGSLFVDTECNSPTYSSAANFTAQAAATDIFTISGSASKTIRIHSITVTAAAAITLYALIRTTANTGGTPIILTNGVHDPNSAAATAVASVWTANPTVLGTSNGGYLEAASILANSPLSFTYGTTDQSIVLRGANQYLALNLNTQNAGTVVMWIKVKWTEI